MMAVLRGSELAEGLKGLEMPQKTALLKATDNSLCAPGSVTKSYNNALC